MHKPIQFKDLGLSFPHKTCFSDFSGRILYGSRIAIIGRNGEGKSTLLKILQGTWGDYEGDLILPSDLRTGYLPQLVDAFETLSGGERINHALTQTLCQNPNLLLLDEPSNHLDKTNRRSLVNHLRHYTETLIMVTHDVALLTDLVDTIWHIQQGKVWVFNGNYADYQRMLAEKSSSLDQEFAKLGQQKKEAHLALMREQERNKNVRIRGEKSISQRKWPTVRSHVNMASAVKTGDKRLSQIKEKKQLLADEWSTLYRHEVIKPQFKLPSCEHQKTVISIQDASIGFYEGPVILHDLQFQMRPRERVALCGDNACGKSTFVKAILGEEGLQKTGDWITPCRLTIGYLDQHYQNLDTNKTVLEMVSTAMPKATYLELRKHLNDFLFRKNEEVEAKISDLSGGEKARLSLCCIAASSPALLILDEMTNNLDLETRAHVIEVLKEYPGAMLIISHDNDFLEAIEITSTYLIRKGCIEWIPSFEEIQ